jgi:hypothetical protein
MEKGSMLSKGFLKEFSAGCWWLMPVILSTQELEIRSIKAYSQPGQIVQETLFQTTKQNKTKHKNRRVGWLKW